MIRMHFKMVGNQIIPEINNAPNHSQAFFFGGTIALFRLIQCPTGTTNYPLISF